MNPPRFLLDVDSDSHRPQASANGQQVITRGKHQRLEDERKVGGAKVDPAGTGAAVWSWILPGESRSRTQYIESVFLRRSVL
jgi:hypothetical protein